MIALASPDPIIRGEQRVKEQSQGLSGAVERCIDKAMIKIKALVKRSVTTLSRVFGMLM